MQLTSISLREPPEMTEDSALQRLVRVKSGGINSMPQYISEKFDTVRKRTTKTFLKEDNRQER